MNNVELGVCSNHSGSVGNMILLSYPMASKIIFAFLLVCISAFNHLHRCIKFFSFLFTISVLG